MTIIRPIQFSVDVLLSVSCWISLETGLLWSFVGPLIVICLVTAFFCRCIISASYLSLISLSSFEFKMFYSRVVYDFLQACTTCFEIEQVNVKILSFTVSNNHA